MLLAIDIGNTNVVFGIFRDKKPDFSVRAGTTTPRTSDEWAVFLDRAFAMRGVEHAGIDRVIMCSVVPMLPRRFERPVRTISAWIQ